MMRRIMFLTFEPGTGRLAEIEFREIEMEPTGPSCEFRSMHAEICGCGGLVPLGVALVTESE
jgi:hypothetical protein